MDNRKTVEKIVEIYEDSLADWERDLPELVRCKDCKHQYEYRTGSCPYYTTYGSIPPDDWYCADGVRK